MSAVDTAAGIPSLPNSPASHAAVVTPSDSVDLGYITRGILCGVAGNIEVITAGGETVVIPIAAGIVYPLRVSRVKNGSTTATGIVALW